ncbi:YadA C-terminal domain-containing protein [Candidatus Spongiihabitans sp.]|uniref:YadA C-terminal domain-containing protein n=1 Tax=Candidatus Spongiihabitans sp. TaxID=3101308 RepID=UPI003C7C7808
MNTLDKNRSSGFGKVLGVWLGCAVLFTGLALPAYGQTDTDTVTSPDCTTVPTATGTGGIQTGTDASSFAAGCNAEANTDGSVAIGDNAKVEEYDETEVTTAGGLQGTLTAEGYTNTPVIFVRNEDSSITYYESNAGVRGNLITVPVATATNPVTLTETKTPEIISTTKKGANAIALGTGAEVRGENTVAIGTAAKAYRVTRAERTEQDGTYHVLRENGDVVLGVTGVYNTGDRTGLNSGGSAVTVAGNDNVLPDISPITAVTEQREPVENAVTIGTNTEASGSGSVVIGAGASASRVATAAAAEMVATDGTYDVVVVTGAVDSVVNVDDDAGNDENDDVVYEGVEGRLVKREVAATDTASARTEYYGTLDIDTTPDDDATTTTPFSFGGTGNVNNVVTEEVTAPTDRVAEVAELKGAVENAVAIGKDASVTGDNGIAIGADVTAGVNEIVIGSNTATRVEVGGVNLAGIGDNADDIDTNTGLIEANDVDIAAHDLAITANTNSVAANTAGIARNADDIDTNRSGIAMSVALAHLPTIKGGGWGIAVGSFDSETAVAVGAHFDVQQNAFIKVGAASSGGETSFGIGFGKGF